MKPTPNPRHPRRASRPGRSRSQGVVLVLALLLLVVITISSVVAMRSAQSNETVSNNLRTQGLALQAAEIALRFCERQVITNNIAALTLVPDIMAPTITDEWRNPANWTAFATAVPAAFLGVAAPGNGLVNFETPPQCLVRRMSHENYFSNVNVLATNIRPELKGFNLDSVYIYRITARGFSPDFQRNAAGVSISGSQAWVQSTIRTTP